MKKFIFTIAAVAAMTLASCTSVTADKEAVEETVSADSVEVLTSVDSTAAVVDSVDAEAVVEVAE